jgi:molybdopterin converting factor small subunit
MTVTIRFFALGRELVGATTLEYSFSSTNDVANCNNTTVADVLAMIHNDHATFARLPSFLVAVNGDYAERTRILHNGDEVAIIPPVSGG